VSWLWTVLLACAVLVLIGAEWPRLRGVAGVERRRSHLRSRRRPDLKIVPTTETEEFAASVERDLDRLPTIEERDRGKPR
jgi:hypothetical protein